MEWVIAVQSVLIVWLSFGRLKDGRRIDALERRLGGPLAVLVLAGWPTPGRAQAVPESPAGAVVRCEADAKTLPPHIAKRTRYLWVPAFDAAALADLEIAVKFWVNSLSRAPDLVPPRKVGERLWAVILDDYSFSAEVWDRFNEFEPTFYVPVEVPMEFETVKEKRVWPGGKDKKGEEFPKGLEYEVDVKRPKAGPTTRVTATAPWLPRECVANLVRLTDSAAPVVRLDNFIVLTSRQLTLENRKTKVGYYDFIEVRNRDDFFKLHGLDVNLSKKLGVDTRAALLDSGVSQGGRAVKRFAGPAGSVWVTEDAFDKTGDGNPRERLSDRNPFKHNAEEIYATKSNGLFAFFAGDDKGNRQDTVPDQVGPDDSKLRTGRDGRIHVIGCCRCHATGLQPINDDIRRLVRSPVQADVTDLDEAILLRRRYFSDLNRKLADDRRVYAAAVEECCGKGVTPAQVAGAMGNAYNHFAVERVTLQRAALECGVTAQQFQAALRRYAAPVNKGGLGQRLPTTLSDYIAEPPGELPRENHNEFLPVIMTVLSTNGGVNK